MSKWTVFFAVAAFTTSVVPGEALAGDHGDAGGRSSRGGHEGRSHPDVGRIYGKIQFVTSFPDFKVQVVDAFEDLKVQQVTSFPTSPGKWQIVTAFPDYKIQIVDAFPDFKIRWVTAFPGPSRQKD